MSFKVVMLHCFVSFLITGGRRILTVVETREVCSALKASSYGKVGREGNFTVGHSMEIWREQNERKLEGKFSQITVLIRRIKALLID